MALVYDSISDMKRLDHGRVITLTTDFGYSDHYVGAMKGVIASLCPGGRIVDITHGVPPFSVLAGAYALAQSAPYFPPKTVHVVVVDPGVGTSRRALVARCGGQFYVAPDNGVLSLILSSTSPSVRAIENERLFRPDPSATFHGRDIFAPVAARLAAGLATFKQVGPRISDPVLLDHLDATASRPGLWTGRVLSIDHFGNIVTTFRTAAFARKRPAVLLSGKRRIAQHAKTFEDGPTGAPFVYAGSAGYLEIGIRQGSAAARLHVRVGDPLTAQVGRDA